MTTIHGDTDTARRDNRALAVLEARANHATWQEAAEAGGFTNKGAAYRAAMTHLRRNLASTVGELRAEADKRHAAKMAVLEDIIYDPDADVMARLRAVDAHTRAEARHAALHGLDFKDEMAAARVMLEAQRVKIVQDAIVDAMDTANVDAATKRTILTALIASLSPVTDGEVVSGELAG